jgi:hypothetical protein
VCAVVLSGMCLLVASTVDRAIAMESTAESPDESYRFVRYEENRLSANVSGMSLQVLLMEIGQQSGAHVRLDGFTDRIVSDRFNELPLEDALRRLLPGESYTVMYAKETTPDGQIVGTRLKELHVYGTGTSVATSQQPPSRPTAAGAEPDAPPNSPGSVLKQFSGFVQRHNEIELEEGSELADALNSDRTSFSTLMTTALHEDDPALRAEAARVMAGVFDGDQEAKRLMNDEGGLGQNVDAVAAVVHTSGGPHAEELLVHMGRHLRTPALRLRANQILARLRRLR